MWENHRRDGAKNKELLYGSWVGLSGLLISRRVTDIMKRF
jgi:hypothetical protein